jgi:hypothetical protein
MPEEIIKEFLKCPLTDAEMKKEAEKMAYSLSKRAELEADLKSFKKQLESEIAKVDAELTSAVTKYQSGFEMRNVECRVDKDFETNTVQVIHLDTLEMIRERAMTGEERQATLFDQKKEETPATEAEGQSEPVVESAKVTTESPNRGDLPDWDKDDPFYADKREKEVEDAA